MGVNKKLFLIISLLVLLAPAIYATVDVCLFYDDECPHCHEEMEFLSELEDKYGDELNVTYLEIRNNQTNYDDFLEACDDLGNPSGFVPFLIVGNKTFIGYDSEDRKGAEIQSAIDELQSGYSNEDAGEKFIVSYFGREIDLMQYSLPVVTFVLGTLDGFNPCAMWVLTFLILLLIETKSKKKMWFVGGTFIIVSGIVYFLSIAAWLNVIKLLAFIKFSTLLIGLFTIGSGSYFMYNFFNYKDECKVTNPGQRKKLMDKMRVLVSAKMTWAVFGGIVFLAFAVNMMELVCSIGLPVVFVKILTLSEVSTFSHYMYLLFYTAMYMLDDFIVFLIAVETFSLSDFTTKYAKILNLVGGFVMILLGIYMVVVKSGFFF